MQKTLLEIVQSTLGSMDSDLVNTIGDTVESEQIAITAQEQFFELATYQRVPQFEQLTQLIGMSDSSRRTVMSIPIDATDIKDVRYKHTDSHGHTYFKDVRYVDKDTFLDAQLQLRVGDSTVGENIFDDNVRVPYRNDRGPTCWTSFDDKHLVFDAIDTVVQEDDTLHNDNSLVVAYIIPTFELRDTFVPAVPTKLFPQYMNMIKEVNSYEQRQIPNEIRTRDAERQGHRNRHFASITDGSDEGFKGSTGQGRSYGRGRINGRGRFR
jgi:hypothetical protein